MRPLPAGIALALAGRLTTGPAPGATYRFDWAPDLDIDWTNKVAVGTQFRVASRNKSFIGESNLSPELSAPDSCISLRRDNLEPHQRWMAAPGASRQIGDKANLTHDCGDVTAAVSRWRSAIRPRLR